MHDRLKPLAGVSLFLLLLACLPGGNSGGDEPAGMTGMVYSMIRAGMSETEVRRLTGLAGERGTELRQENSRIFEVKYALEFQPGYYAAIDYREGAVSGKQIMEEHWHRQRGGISRAAFESIREGMSIDEVARLAGSRGEHLMDARVVNVRYTKVQYLLMDSGDSRALIDFRDGLVRGKCITRIPGASSADAADKDSEF